MIAQLTEGFVLGVATGTTCLATCGPIYAPYLMQYERNLYKSVLALSEISVGRFITYAAVGAIAGAAGQNIAEIPHKEFFTAAAYILFSLFLIVSSFRTHKRERCCAPGRWSAFADRPLVLGLLTGINFCPSFLIAFTKAIDLTGPLSGILLFSAFFVGTTIFLIPVSVFGYFGTQKILRTVARVGALGVGGWFIFQAVLIFVHLAKH